MHLQPGFPMGVLGALYNLTIIIIICLVYASLFQWWIFLMKIIITSFSHEKFRLLSMWIVSSKCCTTQSYYFPTTAISPDTNPFLVHAGVSLHYKLWREKQQHCLYRVLRLYRVLLHCEATPLFVNNGLSLYCGTNPLFIHAGVFTANPRSTRGFALLWNYLTLCPCRFHSKPMVHKGFHCTVEQTHSLSMQGVLQQTLGL